MGRKPRILSKKLKERVEEMDPNGMNCLVENCPNERAVDFCHLVPASLSEDSRIMDSLEWYWNMRNQTLNLDSSRNIFLLGLTFKVIHNEDRFALLPPLDIVAQYMASLEQVGSQKVAVREAFPDVPNGVFAYRFLPLRDMDIMVSRQLEFPPTGNDSFSLHFYPFDTMPDLQSHVHPKFAVLELGRKLAQMPPNILKGLLQTTPVLDDILVLFKAWTSPIPFTAEDDESYVPDHDFPDENDRQKESVSPVNRVTNLPEE